MVSIAEKQKMRLIMLRIAVVASAAVMLMGASLGSAQADEAKADAGVTIEVFDTGRMVAPKQWKTVQPKISMIQYEFSAAATDQDETARITMMSATGSIEANIERWKGQFRLAGDEAFKTETETVAGHTVHIVDLVGTFKETMGGPFAGGRVVEREDYAMVGSIVVDSKDRKFFIKMTGPAAVVKANRDAFVAMLKGLEKK